LQAGQNEGGGSGEMGGDMSVCKERNSKYPRPQEIKMSIILIMNGGDSEGRCQPKIISKEENG
jgi:hypothetical protein